MRKYLRAHPQYSTRIVPLIGEQLSVSDLETVLPNDSLIRLAIANQLSRRPETQANGEALRSQVDYAAARSQASNLNDWLLLAWYAEEEERAELRLEALSEAARLAPLNHALRYQLALFKYSLGDRVGAIQDLRDAVRKAPANRTYLDQLNKWVVETPGTLGGSD